MSHERAVEISDMTNRPDKRIAVFSRDVFFGMRIRTVVSRLGFELALTKEASAFVATVLDHEAAPTLALVDFNQPVDWRELAAVMASDVPVVAFGAHTDVQGFRSAKAAGVVRVVSNGELSRSLPVLIDRYTRR